VPDHERADAHIRVGVDIVEVRRIERLLAEVPEIVETIFTGRELAYCSGRRKRAEHLAVRFAGKEAVLKALGCALGGAARWTDIEIVNEVTGRPRVQLHGALLARAEQNGLADMDISLSHSAQLGIAQVVALTDKLRA
jgi:holo-[acyl-carrier protein] synthase